MSRNFIYSFISEQLSIASEKPSESKINLFALLNSPIPKSFIGEGWGGAVCDHLQLSLPSQSRSI